MARKEKTIHYLYKTTCLITNRYYIGMHSTSNLDDGYMGSGKRLRYSIRKHGKENHIKEILEFFENRDLLIEAEKKAITPEMITDKNCMNLKEGGYGGGGIWSENHKKVFTDAGKQNLIKTKEQREISLAKVRKNKKYREEMSESLVNFFKTNEGNFKNKTHSDETKKLISEKRKGTGVGETNSQFGTCWITKDGVNKKIKKESLEPYLKEGWLKGRK
jgi:hypothetical protein